MLFSASTDKTVAVWDSETGERVKRLKGHTSFVNSCYPARRGPQLVCTGSDDGTVKVGVVCLPSGDLPDQEIEPGSPALQADSLPSEPPGKPHVKQYIYATDTDQWTSSFQECFRAVVYVFSEGLRVETASQDN